MLFLAPEAHTYHIIQTIFLQLNILGISTFLAFQIIRRCLACWLSSEGDFQNELTVWVPLG